MAKRSYNRISYSERVVIEQLSKQGYGVRKISEALNRSPSSISEETRRNGVTIKTYKAKDANWHANLMRKSVKPKEKMHGPLKEIIDQMLVEKHWSPMQISGFLKKHYPNEHYLHVSHQTIYSYIKEPPRYNLLKKYLRRKGKKRRNRSLYEKRGRIKNMQSINKRPLEVEKREIPGHWEGDLIIGKNGNSAMGTLVERSSRYVIIIPLQKRDSKTVTDAFIEELKKFPRHLRKSLTYDQGIEMAYHKRITEDLKMPVYFADAGSPWQRGTNENTNGLIREFFPKKTDLNSYSYETVKSVEDILNKRPKNILGFSTPSKVLKGFYESEMTTLSMII